MPVNIVPLAPTDGITYASAVPLTPTEAVLGDAAQVATVIPVIDGQTLVAIVQLSWSGKATGAGTFIFLQTDLGDGTWIDVAWCFWSGNQGAATFVLCGGGLGAMNNAFQQSRQSSSAPASQANGSNAVPLGGRVRFTGFSNLVGGSSNLAGVTTQVSATITYRLQHPR